ncbi:MAG: hypothetical protein AAF581_13875 [Planctomycetota bacterium]
MKHLRWLACAIVLLALGKDTVAAQGSEAPPAERPRKIFRGWPLLHVERGPGERQEVDAFFSLFNRETLGRDRSTTRLAPLYFAKTTPEDDWSLLAPLYYRHRGANSSSFYSLPLAYGRNESGGSWLHLPYPLSIYRQESKKRSLQDFDLSQRLGLWPFIDVFGRYRDGRASSVDVLGFGAWGEAGDSLLAMFRHRTNHEGQLRESALLPIYHYRSWGQGAELGQARRDRLIVPFLGYASSRNGDRTSRWFWPLLSHWTNTEDHHTAWLLGGLAASVHQDHVDLLRVEPLFSYEKRPSRSQWHALRLFGQEREAARNYRATNILPPLGHFSRYDHGYRHRLAPFYWAGGSDIGRETVSEYRYLLPFYYDQSTAHSSTKVLFPLYYHRYRNNDEQRVVFPLYWQGRSDDKEHLHVFPLYSQLRNGRERFDSVLGNLYIRHIEPTSPEAETTSHSLLWPLFGYASGPDYRHSRALPLWWSTRDKGDEFDLLAPIYLRTKSGARSQHWILPFYGHMTAMDWNGTRTDRSFFAGGSVLHTKKTYEKPSLGTDEHWHVLGPLAGWSRNETLQSSHSRFLPLWWHDRSSVKELTVLLPAFYQYRERRGPKNGPWTSQLTSVVGNLWIDYQTEHRRESGVLYPLTRYRRSTDGESRQLDVLGAYSSQVAGAARSWRLTPLLHVASNQDLAGHVDDDPQWWHIVSHRNDSAGTRTRVMPFLYSRERSEDSEKTTALAGLLASESSPGRIARRILPFYYDERYLRDGELTSSDTVLFPFYSQHTRAQDDWKRQTLLFPFYSWENGRTAEGAYSSNTLLAGLAGWNRSPAQKGAHVFPLYAYKNTILGESDVALSLLYRSRRHAPGSEARGLFSRDGYAGLQLYRSAVGDNTRTIAVNPLLFGYHRDDRSDHVNWNFLHFNRYWRERDSSSYTIAGLVRGGDNARWEWDSAFPLYFSARYKSSAAPGWSLPGLLHLYSRHEDADVSRWSLLGVLASGSSRPNGDYSFRILHKGMTWLRENRYTERTIQPFVTYEHDGVRGRSYFSLLKFLYISSQESADAPVRRRVLGIPLS